MSVSKMSMYFAGRDQFEILSKKKLCNSFVALESDFVFEDIIMDWDLALFSGCNGGGKSSFVKGILTGNDPVQILPTEKTLQFGASKGVVCGDGVYILDQVNSVLYFVTIPRKYENSTSTVLEEVTMERVVFHQESQPEIMDISSSGKESFAIDSQGGVYAVPKLLCRMEGIRWTSIYSGFAFNLLLTDTGAVYSWGNGSRGELGQRTVKLTCEIPSRIDFFDDLPSVVTSLACGGWHSLALTSDGDIYSWGWNESGQLGHSGEKLSAVNIDPYPVDLGSADDPVEKVAAGSRHSVAVLKSAKVFSWGYNRFGQLGLGDYENRTIPTDVKISGLSVTEVSKVQCGRWATFLLTKKTT